jgi:hypothetical protein
VVTALETSLFALALPGLDQVFQTARSLDGRFTALGAAPITLHPQLILSLPRDRQLCELIIDSFSHFFRFRPVKEYLSVSYPASNRQHVVYVAPYYRVVTQIRNESSGRFAVRRQSFNTSC